MQCYMCSFHPHTLGTILNIYKRTCVLCVHVHKSVCIQVYVEEEEMRLFLASLFLKSCVSFHLASYVSFSMLQFYTIDLFPWPQSLLDFVHISVYFLMWLLSNPLILQPINNCLCIGSCAWLSRLNLKGAYTDVEDFATCSDHCSRRHCIFSLARIQVKHL